MYGSDVYGMPYFVWANSTWDILTRNSSEIHIEGYVLFLPWSQINLDLFRAEISQVPILYDKDASWVNIEHR